MRPLLFSSVSGSLPSSTLMLSMATSIITQYICIYKCMFLNCIAFEVENKILVSGCILQHHVGVSNGDWTPCVILGPSFECGFAKHRRGELDPGISFPLSRWERDGSSIPIWYLSYLPLIWPPTDDTSSPNPCHVSHPLDKASALMTTKNHANILIRFSFLRFHNTLVVARYLADDAPPIRTVTRHL